MALSGLDIFKLLPKTNCGECGVPTCMAFAMKLAAKNAELSACPYASDAAKEKIGAASKPPIRLVKIGPADAETQVGNETVMFRHEKTFVHPTAIAISFSDGQSLEELQHLTADVREYCLERVGEELRIDLVLVDNTTGEAEPFVAAVKAVKATIRSLKSSVRSASQDGAAATGGASALAWESSAYVLMMACPPPSLDCPHEVGAAPPSQ